MSHSGQRTSASHSQAVDKLLKTESNHHGEVLAGGKRVKNLESKLFAAVYVEALTRKRCTELAVCLVVENTRRSHMIDARDRVITSTIGVVKGSEGILVRMRETMAKLHLCYLLL